MKISVSIVDYMSENVNMLLGHEIILTKQMV
jgi:hypothetical protein